MPLVIHFLKFSSVSTELLVMIDEMVVKCDVMKIKAGGQ
jgi:hypothetical protein